jgi:hypothetical protein
MVMVAVVIVKRRVRIVSVMIGSSDVLVVGSSDGRNEEIC